MSERYDVVVVGGGHNGMVAAHYLAQAGLSVLIVERREGLGGVTGPIESLPGLTATVTNSPGSLEPKIVQDMRLSEHGLTFVRPDPTVVVPFDPERAFVGWRDPAKVDEGLRQFSRRDAVTYHEIIEFFNDFARRLGVSLFRPPPRFSELAARLRTPRDEADFATIMFGSIKELLDARLESDEVKAVLAMLAQACGNVGPSTPGSPIGLLQRPMSLASSEHAAATHDPRKQPLRGSTGLPMGGMRGLAAAMAASVTATGVDVRLSAAVTDVRVGPDNEVVGVVLDGGEEIDARIVLSNLNPKTLLDLVPHESLGEDVTRGLTDLRMDGAAFKIVLELEDIPRFAFAGEDYAQYAACQFRIGPTVEYLDRAWDDYRYGRPSAAPKLWGLVPTLSDPTLAPEGHHLMSLNVWYAPYHLQDSTWEREKDPFIKRCIALLGDYMPNLPDIIVDVAGFSPADLEREFGLLEGHQLHGDMTPGHMFGFRPIPELSQYSTPVHGLYLCGSGSWPGGFVSGLPGHNAAHAVLADRDAQLAGTELADEIGNRL